MKHVTLQAQRRPIGSKSYLKQLRREGNVPAVLHNQGDESITLFVSARDLKKALHTPAGSNVVLNLEVGKKDQHLARIENIQYDILRENVYTHVEMGKISLEQKIESNVPIVVTGQHERVADDGVISLVLHEITILSKPDEIPANLHADVSKLSLGDVLCVRDIELPEGCTTSFDPDETVVTIIAPRSAEPLAEESSDEALIYDTAASQEPELVE